MSSRNSERQLLRKSIRAKRRSLSPRQHSLAALNLFKKIRSHPDFRFRKRLAFFIAIDGEINPGRILHLAHKLGKQCYLPVIRKDGQDKLLFLRYKSGSKLRKNYFTLSEPAVKKSRTAPAWSLSSVFVPLVAFDAEGSRLGMGKGYYDRTFEFLKTLNRQSPKLLGIAHECQRVDKLSIASWDVPLEQIITDEKIYQA